jgi:hypothetical protein
VSSASRKQATSEIEELPRSNTRNINKIQSQVQVSKESVDDNDYDFIVDPNSVPTSKVVSSKVVSSSN